MLNNKGFAVSSVLYTLLIAFLMFLGATLAMFSSSSSIIGKANDDLINGVDLKAELVKSNNGCDRVIRVRSRYGIMYWPADFVGDSFNNGTIIAGNQNKKIKSVRDEDKIYFEDIINGDKTAESLKPSQDLCK